MNAEEKLKNIKRILKNIRKEVNRCVHYERELTYGGNGINSSECDLFLSALEEELEIYLK